MHRIFSEYAFELVRIAAVNPCTSAHSYSFKHKSSSVGHQTRSYSAQPSSCSRQHSRLPPELLGRVGLQNVPSSWSRRGSSVRSKEGLTHSKNVLHENPIKSWSKYVKGIQIIYSGYLSHILVYQTYSSFAETGSCFSCTLRHERTDKFSTYTK